MTETNKSLEVLLDKGHHYITQASETELSYKPKVEKWSKKEILGHLIDSGINNLQRFTELQFSSRPYIIRQYDQVGLVKANDYQNADTSEILAFWLSLNRRIASLIKSQTEQTLDYEIQLPNGDLADLRFLITDYVAHMEHHLNQIMSQES
ncbi:MAG: DinB family protein [Cyclobacteriaceae bacterium]